jgi:hypothetical protein
MVTLVFAKPDRAQVCPFAPRAPNIQTVGRFAGICHESKSHIHNDTWVNLTYHGDVKQIVDAGFTSVKIDSCGLHSDLVEYADLVNATGHPVMVENCEQHPVSNTSRGSCG